MNKHYLPPGAVLKAYTRVLIVFSSFMLGSVLAQTPGAITAKLKQTSVLGLLVMSVDNGAAYGRASKMLATAVPGSGNVRFQQDVGSDMYVSLEEVQKYMRLRHGSLPEDVDLEISFEDRYTYKDGPSAAVATALLIESVTTGKQLDPGFVVTGDMNADGSVRPVGGLADKIRAAGKGGCQIMGIPSLNESSISDLLLQDGPEAILRVGIFSLQRFDEATALAVVEKEASLAAAVAEWGIIRDVCIKDLKAAATILRTPQGLQRLQAILSKAPHCLSAKYLELLSIQRFQGGAH